jgi:hypothetical protein
MYTTVQVRSKFGKFAYTAICMRNVYTLISSRAILIQSWSEFILGGFYKSELQISCVFAFFTLWKRVKMHEFPSKSIKGSNYGEFLKDKNVLLCTRLYKYAPNLESLLTQQYVCVMCTLWSDSQKTSDWMLMINHPIAVNITNKCGLRNK